MAFSLAASSSRPHNPILPPSSPFFASPSTLPADARIPAGAGGLAEDCAAAADTPRVVGDAIVVGWFIVDCGERDGTPLPEIIALAIFNSWARGEMKQQRITISVHTNRRLSSRCLPIQDRGGSRKIITARSCQLIIHTK